MRIVRWAMFAMYILFLVLACLLWWFAGTEDGRTWFAAKFQILDFWDSTMAVITVPLLLVFAADTYLEYCFGMSARVSRRGTGQGSEHGIESTPV